MSSAPFPPGPGGHWLTGTLPQFRHDRLGFFTHCARTYGDVVGLRFGSRRVFLVCHPELIEEVLVARSRDFIKHFALRLNPLVLVNGLLTTETTFRLPHPRPIHPAPHHTPTPPH